MGKLKYWQGKVYRLIKYSLRLTHISFTSSCTSRKALNFPCKFTKFLIALSIIQIIEAIMTNTFDDNIFEVFFWMLLEKVQNPVIWHVCINRVHKTPHCHLGLWGYIHMKCFTKKFFNLYFISLLELLVNIPKTTEELFQSLCH